ncbi:adhesion G protein-coupled receptor F5 [Aythya fuligula]|uniref:Adhesion G protein-coupled receptor F5 n=1 Tax=Aythya fuligula TaxID=219594 RepID=A0A6J3CTD8_AYTFU|nr:adhesion G protein-coupled receptor F5 [Aythya fuligula]XP_032041551.1 adhesion G protein-coupled receptor F5 [Aythya fuligula]
MPSLLAAALHCLFLLVTAYCHTPQTTNFNPINQYVELGEESTHPKPQWQKTNVLLFHLLPPEYTIGIEITLRNPDLFSLVTQYYKCHNLQISTNISGVEMNISSINVTAVCPPSDENVSCCYCEAGAYNDSKACTQLSLPSNQSCGYIKDMPFYRFHCDPEPYIGDPHRTGEPVIIHMSVTLDQEFSDDLRNSSSVLYKKYKDDFENAFLQSYTCVSGFLSVTIIGFRPGSISVDYDVKARAVTFSEILYSNLRVPKFLNQSYYLIPSSFTTEITNQTNFTVNPVDIFEGDTVTLMCEINAESGNATWYHSNQTISHSSQHLLKTEFTAGISRSTLTIINVTTKDSGSYTCVFSKISDYYRLIYKDIRNITVSSLSITSYSNDTKISCNSPDIQATSNLLFCCLNVYSRSITSGWKLNGTNTTTGASTDKKKCTEYELNITESLCLHELATVMTYTCEFQTGHGARASQNIIVTYSRTDYVRISSSVNTSVSEGKEFKLTCKGDVRNYDSIIWEIQSGDKIQTVECASCITTNKSIATSVLSVNLATQDWNGTYICTFSNKSSNTSANVTVNVIPLPLTTNIWLYPIKTSIKCNIKQHFNCCISANTIEDFHVTFVVGKKEFQLVRQKYGNFLCYPYDYEEKECEKQQNLEVYYRFVNSMKQEVKSQNIQLKLIPESKNSCSENNFYGAEEDTLIKPCRLLSNNFIRGNEIYKCYKKSWKLERNNCVSEQINNLLIRAESLVNSPVAKTELPIFLQQLQSVTELQQNVNSSADVAAIVNILHNISAIPANASKSIITAFFSTVDNIVNDSNMEFWTELNNKNASSSSLLLYSVERFSENLQPVNNTFPDVSTKTLELQGMVVTENRSTDYNKDFNKVGNLSANVLIEKSVTLPPNSTIVSVACSAIGQILPRNYNKYVNSLVVITTLSSERPQNFYINMTFQKANMSLKSPQCVFWNFSFNGNRGKWDNYSCISTDKEGNVTCSCNHLTPFSILMSLGKPSYNSASVFITYSGLAISIVSLVVCIIIESLVWKNVTNNTTSYMRHICILNISTSLLVADIWFIVTAVINEQNLQKNREICIAATFFIHLFYLCGLFWMFSLGLILFYRLVFIFHNTSKTIQKVLAFCLGYGCPFVFAVITIAVTLPQKNYTRKDVCWLNWDDSKALLAFIIPALAIVAMNLFITGVVIIKILRPNIGDKTNKQERKTLFQIGKSLAILTPLLGLTWGFGLATIIENKNNAFHILFALLNTLQGLFILVFGTLWDKKITEALLKRNSLSRWSSQQTKSTSLILVSPMFSMGYPLSRTFNNLCGKTGKYTVSSSEPSSSSENTSKSYSLLN